MLHSRKRLCFIRQHALNHALSRLHDHKDYLLVIHGLTYGQILGLNLEHHALSNHLLPALACAAILLTKHLALRFVQY
jgi:hypothetical protein